MKIFLNIKPPTATHQEKKINARGSKIYVYESTQLQAARAKLTAHLAHYKPETPYIGCLRVITKWCFPLQAKRTDGQWKHTRPDTHNLNKLLFDVMTELNYWVDDSQVTSEIIEKFWAKKCGIYIDIQELGKIS